MPFQVEELSIQLIEALVPAGSAGETQHALRQAVAWRLVTAGEAETATRLVRRIVAILWRMTRG